MKDHAHPLIALIHGVPTAIAPAEAAVAQEIPGARIWNVLDDRLIEEANREGEVTPALLQRMLRLVDHVLVEGADGVLITCSLYSFAAGAASPERAVPILGSDGAAFHDVIRAEPKRVLLVSSVPTALAEAEERLLDTAAEYHATLEVEPVLVDGGLEASRAGDFALLARLVSEELKTRLGDGDIVLFAQYSLSAAAPEVERALGVPVITGPVRAARAMAAALQHPDRRHHQFFAD